MMRRLPVFCFVLVSLCTAVDAPGHAQGSTAQPLQVDADFQKLDAMMRALRNRNAQDYAITVQTASMRRRYVEIGGIEQWITIRGEDRKNPVLLFLHGGPGDATNPWGYAGFRSWLKYFTVVQWDQRGAGRTLGRNGPSSAPTITIDRMAQDGIELAELLRKALQKDKIVLVGHSWGSILGVFMVKARPDLFYAFVGTGQVADPVRNYAVAYDELLKKAETPRGSSAPSESSKKLALRLTQMAGVTRSSANGRTCLRVRISSSHPCSASHSAAPGYSLRDINDWIEGQDLSAQRLIPQTSKLESKDLGGDFALPVFVIQGAEDFTTPTSLARSFLNSLRAPRKAFVTVEGGGHFAVFMKSDVFLKELVARVLPLTTVH